jgi:MFS transporter, PPP family, 3-phenylpropionic acid transporter
LISPSEHPELIFYEQPFFVSGIRPLILIDGKLTATKIMTNPEIEPNRRDLWLMRAFYFSALGGVGFISPFLNLFFTRQGLTGTQIGFITSAGSIIAMVVAPLWTSESTRRNLLRQALQLSLVLSAASYLLLGLQRVFLWILVVNILRMLFSAALNPLSDSLAVSVTGATRSGFGSVRVWASFGWSVIVLSSGWLIQQFGMMTAFIGTGVMLCVGFLLLFQVQPALYKAPENGQSGLVLRDIIHQMIQTPAIIAVGLMMIAIGLGNSGINQFEIVYMSQLGAKEGVLGIAGMVSSVVEIPCMLWSDRLVRKHGARKMLMIAMLSYAVLRTIVFVFPSILTIILERGVGGIAFSFYTVSLVRFLSDHSTAHERGTVMALFTITLANLIAMIATPLSGIAYDHLGAHWLYLVAIVGYLLGWLSLQLTMKKD